MTRPTIIRTAIFMATVVAIWGVLSLGGDRPDLNLEPDTPAPETYEAVRHAVVEDVEETERAREQARQEVEAQRFVSTEVQDAVINSIESLFSNVADSVASEDEIVIDEIPELPESQVVEEEEEPQEGEETTVPEPEPSELTGTVFLDVDGDGVFDPEGEDVGLAGVRMVIHTSQGDFARQTGNDGSWSIELETDAAVISVDVEGSEIPRGWAPGSGELAQLVECIPGQPCQAGEIGFVASLRPLPEVEADIGSQYGNLPLTTVSYLAATASEDVVRDALGQPTHLTAVHQAVLQRVNDEFINRIEIERLSDVQLGARTNPPLVFHQIGGQDQDGTTAAGEIVAVNLQANYLINPSATEQLEQEAAEAVVPHTVEYQEGSLIVARGDTLTRLHIDAIAQAAFRPGTEPASLGLLAMLGILVGVVGLYLSRFRKEIWSRPRMVSLLGILMLLAAASVRGTVLLSDTTSLYILPVVAFGFVTAILFDQRIALLMALSVGVITAVGTHDLGITVYAVLATIAPIPFVSAVSSRGAFRNAVAMSSVVAAGVAAATAWFFHLGPNDVVLEVVGGAVVWAFVASMVASLAALAGLQFFESAFDVTTTLSLLDLTDRNHEALQHLQEKAFGTFNHSLMVGTLADAASRAIGANPLLARAMAYYHDLGKTENPTFFIENQFGIQNPHDFLDPKESAQILRSHVSEGIALARRFKIPTDVAQGIVSHHGDGVMRFFYEKARATHGDEVNVDDFRHIGHKPRTAETAILMLADSLEAACRAVFQVEEPTADAIEKVVNRIIDEKVEDGQLSESPLTLAELTQIRKAFLDSLVGHYHQRIAYPNFPGEEADNT